MHTVHFQGDREYRNDHKGLQSSLLSPLHHYWYLQSTQKTASTLVPLLPFCCLSVGFAMLFICFLDVFISTIFIVVSDCQRPHGCYTRWHLNSCVEESGGMTSTEKEGRRAFWSCSLIVSFFILQDFRGNIKRRKMATDCSASNDIKWFESDTDGIIWEATINSLKSFSPCLPTGLKKKDTTEVAVAQELSRKAFISTSSPGILSDRHKKNKVSENSCFTN